MFGNAYGGYGKLGAGSPGDLANQAQAVKGDSPYEACVNELEQALQRLDHASATLLDRLHPVLSPVPPQGTQANEAREGSAPMLNALIQATGRVNAFSDRLQTITERLVL